jgi:hypothetical protein
MEMKLWKLCPALPNILTFSFHIVVYYAVTQRSLCLMVHKSRDVTSLVVYSPVARMSNASQDILDGTGESSSKI